VTEKKTTKPNPMSSPRTCQSGVSLQTIHQRIGGRSPIQLTNRSTPFRSPRFVHLCESELPPRFSNNKPRIQDLTPTNSAGSRLFRVVPLGMDFQPTGSPGSLALSRFHGVFPSIETADVLDSMYPVVSLLPRLPHLPLLSPRPVLSLLPGHQRK
jgi:hypothetical protein